ncbi:MAG: excalibur calcium-binding domain-containing protein [Pasteurellaceae bacterium]|nr:excalibur calcium-binding domain-containing protein [Pasteurellaceae bacterium]
MKIKVILSAVLCSLLPIAHAMAEPQQQETQYQCDGRQYCSQMRSCDEARYFNRYCPNTKMDGDRDGKPCENWCGH